MMILSVTEARTRLCSLIDEIADTRKPIAIKGKRGNAVLISEQYWNSIRETLHLLSVPVMKESIKTGLEEKTGDCSKELDW